MADRKGNGMEWENKTFVAEELARRALPDYFTFCDGTKVISINDWKQRRGEIIGIVKHEMFGQEPSVSAIVQGITKLSEEKAFAGKAEKRLVSIEITMGNTFFSFPCHIVLPKNVEKPPVFLYLSFSPAFVDEFLPAEEILDHGYAIASFYYQDIAPDQEDRFRSGLAGLFPRNPYDCWGKIAMWSWAASRVMDYLQTLPEIDRDRIAVAGHSRLGKTALWCGAQDERFSLVAANNSGAGGAALFREKKGERIESMLRHFPRWFCGNFQRYGGLEMELPFDQHFLSALIAPRHLYISSAAEDEWADPLSEYLGCAAANKAYELFGKQGLVSDGGLPGTGQILNKGFIGYHIRSGEHYFSRFDWLRIIDYRNQHGC